MPVPRNALRIVRVTLAVGIVAWLVSTAGFEHVVRELTRAETIPLVLAFMAMAAEAMLRARTWHALLTATCRPHPNRYSPLLSAYLASSMLGSLVPSSAGTDVLRAGMSHRMIGGHFVTHAASVVMQNALSFFAACLLGLLGLALLWGGQGVPNDLAPLALPLTAIAAGVPIAYMVFRTRRGLLIIALRRLRRRWFRLRQAARRFLNSLFVFEQAHAHLGRVLLISLTALLAQSAFYALAGAALGVALPAGGWILLPAVIAVAGFLPASFLGFGAIQAANVYILASCA